MAESPPGSAVALVPMIFLGALVIGIVINLVFPLPIWPSIWTNVIGLVPLLVGIWLFASARTAFRRRRTPVLSWETSVELVQDGPYRFSRNPLYLSIVLMYLGTSLIVNSLVPLVVLILMLIRFDRHQIPREERYLQERFGEEYSRYKARVHRWI